ncbi:SnoaL-like polyketide cyclase [Tamaricihabitans halophyticus]|uniref:SnoaL-like polyketide cyclase n=1 Tax=Tamaricihabitans halophyticus TaxID=1262583 RepID=A0A4R2R3V9_9PSEU|nr:ester cyclase [Tamaricihabitans halophyticus]TCP57253.1 SnoaL-like polyketide cyclase [Tamaricihabitans halophyticus]
MDLRELYRQWLPGAWNADPVQIPDLIAELFAPDALGHWPSREINGADGIAEAVVQAVTMFDDVHVELVMGPIADGDLVAAQWYFNATYRGDFPGATAAAGTRISYRGADILRAEGDRFVEYWPHGDDLSFMKQLGVTELGTS